MIYRLEIMFIIAQGNSYLIVATQSAIMQMSLNGMRRHLVVSDLAQGVAIDYDYR